MYMHNKNIQYSTTQYGKVQCNVLYYTDSVLQQSYHSTKVTELVVFSYTVQNMYVAYYY